MYEIWGGSLDNQSFYDGGPADFLEDCDTLAEAIVARDEWRQQKNYSAWICDKETGEIVKIGLERF